MDAFYKPPFWKFVKKQPRPFQLIIEDEIENIILKPETGEAKTGNLSAIRVHKFTYKRQRYLIAYRDQKAQIVFFKIGPHENFYRELKKYLREVDS